MPDHQHDAGLDAGVADPLGRLHGVGDRLLYEHVPPGGGGLDRVLGVGVVGRGDQHALCVVALDQFEPRATTRGGESRRPHAGADQRDLQASCSRSQSATSGRAL
jgi:hypothetical protein